MLPGHVLFLKFWNVCPVCSNGLTVNQQHG